MEDVSKNIYDELHKKPEVKDSGKRYVNENGGQRDISEGKPDFKYVPFILIKNIYYCNDDEFNIYEHKETIEINLLEILYKIRNEDLSENFLIITKTIKDILITIGIETAIEINKAIKYSLKELIYFGLEKFAIFMERCASKYSFENWKLLTTEEDIERAKISALRHYEKAVFDRKDEFHKEATVFNLMCLSINYQKFLGGKDA